MNVQIIPTPVTTDSPLDNGGQIGDEILLATTAATKVAKVKVSPQAAPSVRAWSFGGRVD